jgi:hypothetical protein
MSTFPTTKRGITAALFGRYMPPTPLTEVVPEQGVIVSRQGQPIVEQSAPSARLVNLIEQQNLGTQTAVAEAARVQRLLNTKAGIREVCRTR